jgi:hypothetical protein
MRIVKVIPSRVWRDVTTGKTASIYGCKPEGGDWFIETVGWTWLNDNGTVGLGRVPAKTESEAIEIMDRINNRIS